MILENHRDLTEPVTRNRARGFKPRNPRHRGFNREGYEPFDVERPEIGFDRVDLHLLVGDVGNGINRQLQKLRQAVSRDDKRQDDHAPAEADRRV